MDKHETQTTSARGSDELRTGYANNVFIEESVWDLKILFGQLEQHTGRAEVRWHSAMTLPWSQAKILSYLLDAFIATYETTNGEIHVPEAVRPPRPPDPPADLDDGANSKWIEAAQAAYDRVFSKRRK